jgi:hypothetical protein
LGKRIFTDLHVHFGILGKNNHLNVLDLFPLVANLLSGASNDLEFQVNGNQYSQGTFY